MKTQTDRKIAEELQRTYEAQREAQMQRQDARARDGGRQHAGRGRAQRADGAHRRAERARGRGHGARRGERHAAAGRRPAAAVRLNGDAEADATRAVGAAKAEAYRQGVEAVGAGGYTAMQLAAILGEHRVKLVPDIAVGGDGAGRLVDVMIAKMLGGPASEQTPRA